MVAALLVFRNSFVKELRYSRCVCLEILVDWSKLLVD